MTTPDATFAFIPRALKKKRIAEDNAITKSAGPLTGRGKEEVGLGVGVDSEVAKPSPDTPLRTPNTRPALSAPPGSLALPLAEDLAGVVCLALSDYALWADAELRRKVDWGSGGGSASSTEWKSALTKSGEAQLRVGESGEGGEVEEDREDNRGYIPLAYLLKQSSIFKLCSASPTSSSSILNQPQTAYIKSLRAHAPLIDARLILPSIPPPGKWSKAPAQTHTGYEVRRKPGNGSGAETKGHGKREWDALTVYMENIPVRYRCVPALLRFCNALLLSSPTTSSPDLNLARVQNIAFPPHHQDQPPTLPTCKGFALITLAHSKDVRCLIEAWPWVSDGDATFVRGKDGRKELRDSEELTEEAREAKKFGLRILEKARWVDLRTEYLEYRGQLVDEINAFQDQDGGERDESGVPSSSSAIPVPGATHAPGNLQPHYQVRHPSPTKAQAQDPPPTAPVPALAIHPNSPYPPGCLVFVRNIHPGTNKTTLRGLFLSVMKQGDDLGSASAREKEEGGGVDYLDYAKGMDSVRSFLFPFLLLRIYSLSNDYRKNTVSPPPIHTQTRAPPPRATILDTHHPNKRTRRPRHAFLFRPHVSEAHCG
ncbi:hypothetical protein B0H34DRAFT_690767 [Crassisporium funariophilum]|nr:hypothetical protein B0H34DRAFT_690767 [Crassisporium funariophilum]